MSTAKASKYVDYTVDQLLSALSNEAEPGSMLLEEIKGVLSAKLTTQLAGAIDRHEKASSCLAKQMLILNIFFGVFTVVGVGLTVWQLLKLYL